MSRTFFFRSMIGSLTCAITLVGGAMFITGGRQDIGIGCIVMLGLMVLVPILIYTLIGFLLAGNHDACPVYWFFMGLFAFLIPPYGLACVIGILISYMVGFILVTSWTYGCKHCALHIKMKPNTGRHLPSNSLSIHDFVISARQNEISESEIKIRLQDAGWSAEEIKEALKEPQ